MHDPALCFLDRNYRKIRKKQYASAIFLTFESPLGRDDTPFAAPVFRQRLVRRCRELIDLSTGATHRLTQAIRQVGNGS